MYAKKEKNNNQVHIFEDSKLIKLQFPNQDLHIISHVIISQHLPVYNKVLPPQLWKMKYISWIAVHVHIHMILIGITCRYRHICTYMIYAFSSVLCYLSQWGTYMAVIHGTTSRFHQLFTHSDLTCHDGTVRLEEAV